ncbi:MAG: hypothetical protein U0587_03455 [Candidatus Binatia bacterium]
MRTAIRSFAWLAAALGLQVPTLAGPLRADPATVGILVVKEHGVSSPSLVQPHLDRFVAIAAKQNDWADAKGQYYNNRSAAEAFIDTQHPHYGIFSLPAFLAMREKYRLDVVGQVAVALAGGRQYFLISKTATDLAGCKGKAVASDHTDDKRFIERVVAGGTFTLADFTMVHTQRPLQTIKKVMANEAACALIDDAQLAELSHLEGADGIRPVWKSAELPPMVVTAFPAAPAAERARFQDNLARLCENDAQSACTEVGIVALKAAGASDYAALVTAYEK